MDSDAMSTTQEPRVLVRQETYPFPLRTPPRGEFHLLPMSDVVKALIHYLDRPDQFTITATRDGTEVITPTHRIRYLNVHPPRPA